ncbi:unnamed protein product, partial [Mesorhabditis spiculigera]
MASHPYPTFPDFPPKHIRHCIYFEFCNGSNPKKTAQKINDVYGEGATDVETCAEWFHRFRSGDTSMEEIGSSMLSARPVQESIEEKLKAVDSESRISSRKMAEQLGVPHQTVLKNLKVIGQKAKRGQWSPEANKRKSNISQNRRFSAHK